MCEILLLLALVAARDDPPRRADSPAPPMRDAKTDVVSVWNDLALEAIRGEKTSAPQAARHLALLHTAIYDAIITIYHPSYKPYRVSLRAKVSIDPDLAASAAAHRVLTTLYPKQKSLFDAALERSRSAIATAKDRTLAEKLGQYVADRSLAARRGDGSQRPGSYTAKAEIGIWRPTLPGNSAAHLPAWGEVKAFGLRDRDRLPPLTPLAITSKEYTDDLREVQRLGGRSGSKRTADQTLLAWFWDDAAGTSSIVGHWNQIAQEVTRARGLQWPDNARLFALLNIALADAGIVCHEAKYRHKVWRPITAIREGDRDGNPDTEADANWVSLLHTPASPSFPSAHSAFSAAAATVLGQLCGKDDVEFTIGSDGFPGNERTYGSFGEAAREAARSRIYAGVSFSSDTREGLALGKNVAEEVLRTQLLSEESSIRMMRENP